MAKTWRQDLGVSATLGGGTHGRTRADLTSITLTKHHGLGNDFLIAVDPALPLGPEQAARWCDRRRGVGADGLIAAEPHGEDPKSWSMSLWNTDGSRAELSGNGLRCLGQALVLHRDDGGAVCTFRIQTDAGERLVEVRPNRDADTDDVTVDMGRPRPGPADWPRWADLHVGAKAQSGVDIGNPHLVVLVDDPHAIDLEKVGPIVESDYPEGVNVEFILVESRTRIVLDVWERGVGMTEACGSGACAAVWAAHQWDMVGGRTEVVMPGGTSVVEVVGGRVSLTGPATFVAVVEMEHS